MRDRLRELLRTAAQSADAAATRAAAPLRALMESKIRAPNRLRVAPQDIRTSDATVAEEIHAGYFSFDGKSVNTRGRSPFDIEPPSQNWRRSLAGFAWLRHLRVADTTLARENARALVEEFIDMRGLGSDDPAFEPETTARRMISFLAHAPMLLEDVEPEFAETFMDALARSAKALSRALVWRRACGADRLFCALALLEFCLCAEVDAELKSLATKLFVEELDCQILPDGGHIGRNPQILLELLLDLLPLRKIYAARGIKPPQALLGAIDRMIPMLRLLQHGDGALALFNGMGATNPGALATVFAHEAAGAALSRAPLSGYQRIAAREALVIVDSGAPPPQEFSRRAHAGALAFEFSLGPERVVVNCGAPAARHESARDMARASAAHSTLVLDDQSSSPISPITGKSRSGQIVAGARTTSVKRRALRMGEALEVSHDGYAARFGLIHERVLALTRDGARFIGQDRLAAARSVVRPDASREFALRFHLHPNVSAKLRRDGRGVELTLASGARIAFEASQSVRLEESVFFAAPEGPRATTQIVLTGPAAPQTRLRWSFSRAGAARTTNGDGKAAVPAPVNS